MAWLTGSKQGEAKKLLSQLGDPIKRDHVAQELVNLGADAVPPLVEALQTSDLNLLPLIEQILAHIPSASPTLIKALSNAHPLIRGRAAEVFAISKDKSAIPTLLEALKGEYFTVRARAALALSNMGEQAVLPALLPLLKDDEAEVRLAACTAIGKFRDPFTFDELANVLLDDPRIEVRRSAVRALGDAKHPAAIQYLMEALHDSFWWYEREQNVLDLLNAIENMGSSVVEPLIEALGDHEGTVRKYAALILGKLGDARAIEELGMTVYDLHHEVGRTAAAALAKFGPPAVDILIEALQHPEAGIRENAVLALGTIQDVRVAPALIEMLHDPEREVQKQALQSLGGMRDERVLPIMKEVASNRADREMSMLAKQILETLK